MDRDREDNVAAVVFKSLQQAPLRHQRERIYRALEDGAKAGKFPPSIVATMRARFGDEGTTEVVACACGQKNRVNLRSVHERDVGPRCGRCKEKLPEAKGGS